MQYARYMAESEAYKSIHSRSRQEQNFDCFADLHHMDAYEFMEHAIHVIREFGLNSPQYSYIMAVSYTHLTLPTT